MIYCESLRLTWAILTVNAFAYFFFIKISNFIRLFGAIHALLYISLTIKIIAQKAAETTKNLKKSEIPLRYH